ncbi:MAG: CoA ester lyase [Thermoleophilaceae bacterium]
MTDGVRSLLFAPGNDPRKLSKALASCADVVIADLEDSVPAAEKANAREVAGSLLAGHRGPPRPMVRVNDMSSRELDADLELTERLELAAIVVPKATPATLRALAGRQRHPIVAVIETAAGVLGAGEVAASPGVRALALGSLDLAAECGLSPLPGGQELLLPRARLVFESAAAGIAAPYDGAYLQVRDRDGFEAEAKLARGLGFAGKVCLNPSQAEVANEVFSQEEERRWAERTLEAHARASADGRGAIEVDGEMIDIASVRRAERILALQGNREDT